MNKEILAAMLAYASLGKEILDSNIRWLIHRHHNDSPPSVEDAMVSLLMQGDDYYAHEDTFKAEGNIWFNTIKDLHNKELVDKYPTVTSLYLKHVSDLGLKITD